MEDRPHDSGYEALVQNERKPTAWQRLFSLVFLLMLIHLREQEKIISLGIEVVPNCTWMKLKDKMEI